GRSLRPFQPGVRMRRVRVLRFFAETVLGARGSEAAAGAFADRVPAVVTGLAVDEPEVLLDAGDGRRVEALIGREARVLVGELIEAARRGRPAVGALLAVEV